MTKLWHEITVESYEEGKEIMQFILTSKIHVTKIDLLKNRYDENWRVKYLIPSKDFIKKYIDK